MNQIDWGVLWIWFSGALGVLLAMAVFQGAGWLIRKIWAAIRIEKS